MSWFRDMLGGGRPEEVRIYNAERAHFEHIRNEMVDHLSIATVDATGKRLKERDVRTAIKTLERL